MSVSILLPSLKFILLGAFFMVIGALGAYTYSSLAWERVLEVVSILGGFVIFEIGCDFTN